MKAALADIPRHLWPPVRKLRSRLLSVCLTHLLKKHSGLNTISNFASSRHTLQRGTVNAAPCFAPTARTVLSHNSTWKRLMLLLWQMASFCSCDLTLQA